MEIILVNSLVKAENLLINKGNPGLVKKYLVNFDEHLRHSDRYEGRN
jgi:hypothetical protein